MNDETNDPAPAAEAPSVTPRTKRRLPWLTVFIFIGGSMAILAFAVALSWSRITGYWNSYQAAGYLSKAEEAVAAEEWQEASSNYGRAYLEAPNDPKVIRAIAKFMQKTGGDPERTLAFWRQLMDTGAGTDLDKVSLVQTYLQLGKPSEARQVFNTIQGPTTKQQEALEIEAALLAAEGHTAEATSKLREAMLLKPGDPESKLKLAEMDLRSPLTEVQNAAVNTLWSLARANQETSFQAINLLINQARLNRSDFDELLKLVNTSPKTEKRQRYAVLSKLLERYPEEKETLLAAEENTLDLKVPDQLTPYLLMLQSIGEHDRVLKLLPADNVTKLREYFSLYAESTAAKGDWAALRAKLQSAPSLPISAADLALLKARMSKALNEPSEVVRGHLLDAAKFATAGRDIRHVRRISAIANSMGYPGVALEVLKSGATLPQHRIAMLETVLDIQTSQLDAEGMLDTLNSIVETQPKLTYHLETQLYLKSLLGSEIELLPSAIQGLGSAAPGGETMIALLQALTAYRFQDIETLKDAIQKVEPDGLKPGQRAVLSGLLNVSGEPARAFQIAERIPAALLLPEERRFLNLAL